MAVSCGEKLKELRENRTFPPKTQTELGNAVGVGLRQYQRYEEGSIPEIPKLVALSTIFNYDLISHISAGKWKLINDRGDLHFVRVGLKLRYADLKELEDDLKKDSISSDVVEKTKGGTPAPPVAKDQHQVPGSAPDRKFVYRVPKVKKKGSVKKADKSGKQ